MVKQETNNFTKRRIIMIAGAVLLSSLCFSGSLNLFYIPNNILSAGVPGLAQLIIIFAKTLGIEQFISAGNLYFILNIPIMLLSYFKLGKEFTYMTLISIVAGTLMSNVIPVHQVTHDPMLASIAGGTIAGIGVGVLIKNGLSSGGFDIIALVISKETGINVGFMSFLTNMIVIIGAGALFNWEYALYTLIAIFIAGQVIDAIHTGEQRMTAFIISKKEDEVLAALRANIVRGVTILEGEGGYTGHKRRVMMMVLNRYEVSGLEAIIRSVDPEAFINVVRSTSVNGNFLNKEQQLALLKQASQFQ